MSDNLNPIYVQYAVKDLDEVLKSLQTIEDRITRTQKKSEALAKVKPTSKADKEAREAGAGAIRAAETSARARRTGNKKIADAAEADARAHVKRMDASQERGGKTSKAASQLANTARVEKNAVAKALEETHAKRRRFDVLVCWRLDRLGRNLKHLITLLDDVQALGIAFVSLTEGIDATTPAGKLQLHILGAIAEFERGRIQERVLAGLARARSQGKTLGRPKGRVPVERLAGVASLSLTKAATALGVSLATIKRWRQAQKSVTATA